MDLKEIAAGYRDKMRQLCSTEPQARRNFDMATTIGMSEDDAFVVVAVHGIECLKSTQQDLLEAQMVVPPDAFYVRNEDGTRSLVRYIGPTIQELRAEAKKKAKKKSKVLKKGESANPNSDNYIGHNEARKRGLAKCICKGDERHIMCPFHGR